jgi:hypothetical protein
VLWNKKPYNQRNTIPFFGGSVSYKSYRPFAQAMLMRFADYKAMKDLLPDSYIDKANQLLDDLLKRTRAPV